MLENHRLAHVPVSHHIAGPEPTDASSSGLLAICSATVVSTELLIPHHRLVFEPLPGLSDYTIDLAPPNPQMSQYRCDVRKPIEFPERG